jgi:hypothetical protein
MRPFRFTRPGRPAALRLGARLMVAGYAAFAALNAQAQDLSAVSGAFGNTIVSTYQDGRSQKIWLHPDGTWSGLSRRNTPLAGHWTLKGEKVCLRQSQPPTLPLSYCAPFPAHSEPGVQWSGRDMGGRSITLSLQKGMPPGAGGAPQVESALRASAQHNAGPHPIAR